MMETYDHAATIVRYTLAQYLIDTPHIKDFAHHLRGKHIFLKNDLVRAYHQILSTTENVEKIAITTPFGLFETTTNMFVLRKAAQTCQRFVDEITRGLDFVYAYIDDFLIASDDENQHY